MLEDLKNVTSKIFDEVVKEFKEDASVKEFFKDKKSLDKFANEHKEMLLEYISTFNDEDKDEQEQCRKFYEAIELPYAIITKYVNILQIKLKKYFLDKVTSYEEKIIVTESIADIFESLVNTISKVHIQKECNSSRLDIRSKFVNYSLFNVHVVWINKILDAILSNDMDHFPQTSAKSCEFAQMITYPESLMVCMDIALCNQLDVLHEMVHTKAKILYRYLVKGEFTQAYFVFVTLMESSHQFFSLLKELYYLTYSDLENSFFKLIDMLSYSDKKQTLTILDIKNIKKLNSVYGERKLDKILENIKKLLEKYMKKHQENVLAIRAISSNFYILHLDTARKIIQNDTTNILQNIDEILKEKFPKIDIDFALASFELDKRVHYQKDELVRIMLHLKEDSKIKNKKIFIFDQASKNSIRKWLNEKYFNIEYIKKKIDNREVDVMLQPIYDTQKEEIYAVEVLARFVDGRKLLPAGIFIDTVYEIGLITELDILVLDAIMAKKEYILEKEIKVFINSSAQSLVSEKYINRLDRFLNNFFTDNVIIEITEQQALKNLNTIKGFYEKYGVKFAIDDFGSGYSALKTVSDLVEIGLVEVLKIDGTLIYDMDKNVQTQKIVHIITQMCDTFGIYSLAEFIENKETLDILKRFGTRLAQGFYLSKPLIVEELRAI